MKCIVVFNSFSKWKISTIFRGFFVLGFLLWYYDVINYAYFRFIMANGVYEQFAPVLIFFIISTGIGVVFSLLGKLLSIVVGANNPNATKGETFECGFSTFGDAREKLDVRFYLVAVLFLVFDLELAFIIPWGVNLRSIDGYQAVSNSAFMAMIVFLTVLFLGLVYGWKKGALEWE